MSDETVRAALRSNAPLVVVEAPAGCGKTHQGADYARENAMAEGVGRGLILTHTHAACSMFSDRTKGAGFRVEIRTIDSVIAHIASAYHLGLGLPADTAAWARQQEDGYADLALRVASLLKKYPMIAASLSQRYPIVICDEHQDSSGDQHAVILAMLEQGAKVRIFADPMQKIFKDRAVAGSNPPYNWGELVGRAQASEGLDTPHRWSSGCEELGRWTLQARLSLKVGGKVDLRNGLPSSVSVIIAENQAQRRFDYRLSGQDRRALDSFVENETSLLVLTRYNETAQSFRGFFNRRIPLWEGHTRHELEGLVDALNGGTGNRPILADAVTKFVEKVARGCGPSAFGNIFKQEVQGDCTRSRRGKPAAIQALARILLEEPDHRGVSKVLRRLWDLKENDANFTDVKIDCLKEFWDAVRLGDFENVTDGLAEITHRRTYSRPKPPDIAISTIHKAKGLECDGVIVMPCDVTTFQDKPDARCLLYVALSRAKKRLMLVVSRDSPSPLFEI